MDRLIGKTSIVTGATAGIGAAIVRRLHAEGSAVVLVARSHDVGMALTRDLGERTAFVGGSVTDARVVEAAVKAAHELGGLDVLVNNAGIDLTGDLLAATEQDARRVFEVNVFGALWFLQRVARDMVRTGGGSIINVTSRLASIGVPGMAVYAASKGALVALTRNAAVELAPLGVRVNAVAPGLTETPLLSEWVGAQPEPDAFRASLAAAIPQKRLGTPDDVAAAVAFLAADESSHITGASLAIDGGYTAA
jgi:NAD(P)-dependent dehydrogenase (short-subunit alcohol dehydrogenase family)